MDRHTIGNYGWIVIAVIIVAMLITLSIPLSARVMDSVSNVLGPNKSDNPVMPGPDDNDITTVIPVRIESSDKTSIRYTIGAGYFDYVKIYKNENLVATIRQPNVANGDNIYSFAGTGNTFVYGDVIKIECYQDLNTLVGTGVGVYNFKDGDNTPPVLTVITPQGTSIQNPTYVKTNTSKYVYTVTGTVTDDKGVKNVTVNGKEAVLKLDGTWSVEIELPCNETTVLSIIAKDSVNNEFYETRMVRAYTTPYLQKGSLFNSNIASNTTSVVFTDAIAPTTITPVDISKDQNGSVVAWTNGTTVYVSSQVKGETIIAHEDCSEMFYNKTNLTSINLSKLDTSNTTKMARMFYKCSGFTSLDLSGLTVTNVVEMDNMFNSCSNLTTLNVNNWNTGKVTSMKNLFYDCAKLSTLNVSGWNTSNVEDMSSMFRGCSGLTSLNVDNFVTSKVTDMSNMFNGLSGITTTINVSGFNTSKVLDMSGMFNNCSKLTTLNITNFNTSTVKNTSNMFYNCSKLTELDLSNFDTKSVTNMKDMFYGCTSLKKVELGTAFAFVGSNGYLPTPNPSYISGAIGKWFSATSDGEYNPSEIPNNKADIYVATKLEGKVEFSATSGTVEYPNKSSFTIQSNLSGGSLSVSVADPTAATVTLEGTKVTITPLKPGATTTITVTSAATVEYRKATATYTLTIKKGIICLFTLERRFALSSFSPGT